MSLLLVFFYHNFPKVLSFETKELLDFLGWADLLSDFFRCKCVNQADQNSWTEDKDSKVVDLPLNSHVETGHFYWVYLVLLKWGHRVEEKCCEEYKEDIY